MKKFFNYNYRPIKNKLQVIFIAEVVKISDVFKKIRLQGFCRHIFSFHVLLPNFASLHKVISSNESHSITLKVSASESLKLIRKAQRLFRPSTVFFDYFDVLQNTVCICRKNHICKAIFGRCYDCFIVGICHAVFCRDYDFFTAEISST